jgi:hypothetical protein
LRLTRTATLHPFSLFAQERLLATYTGTDANNSWTVVNPGTFTLDGLGGIDTLYLGTSRRSDYRITQGSDGSVHVDSVSGASQQLHATLRNMEVLVFDNKKDTLELSTLFGDTTAPTVTITDNRDSVTNAAVTYTLNFSENVTGLAANDFTVSNGHVVSVAGSGARYTVVVDPATHVNGTLGLTLVAGAVTDASNNPNAAKAAAGQAIDTLPPAWTAVSPTDGAANVAVDRDIVVTFNEPIVRGSGLIVIRDLGGNTVASYDGSSANVAVQGQTLTIHPSDMLPSGSTLVVELTKSSVLDALGNAFEGSSYTFSTGDGVVGTSGNDSFTAASGHYQIDGAGGLDTVDFSGLRANYAVSHAAGSFTVTASDGSSVIDLSHVERLQFSDVNLALDLDGHAGETAMVLGAVFGADAVGNQAYVGIGLQLLDGGFSFDGLMQLALDARLGSGASHTDVVDLLYENVVGSAPNPEAEAYYVGLLDSQQVSTAGLGIVAAETELNLSNIDLVGLTATGLLYTGG